MASMAAALENAGYTVVNTGYPSRAAPIEALAGEALPRALRDPRLEACGTIHFVTHSMGGILVRWYFGQKGVLCPGRAVMLAPPNQGSEVVDKLAGRRIFRMVNGPAGAQLGTEPGSMPNRLGAPDFEVGVIAGSRSINWMNSLWIPGRDDGKVSIERTRLRGMRDHVVVPAAHPFIMRNAEAVRQTLVFLRTGAFAR